MINSKTLLPTSKLEFSKSKRIDEKINKKFSHKMYQVFVLTFMYSCIQSVDRQIDRQTLRKIIFEFVVQSKLSNSFQHVNFWTSDSSAKIRFSHQTN